MTVQTLPAVRTRIALPARAATRHDAEDLIWRNGTAAHIACEHMTQSALNAVRDTVAWASSLPARPGWERKAAAHAELFRLIASLAGDRMAAAGPGGPAGLLEILMCTVGPVADGMIMSSRRRLVAHLSAGDAGKAAHEVESHLRVLLYMGRLAMTAAPATTDG